MVIYEIICREVPFEEEEPSDVGKYTLAGVRPDMGAVPPDAPQELVATMWREEDSSTLELISSCFHHDVIMISSVFSGFRAFWMRFIFNRSSMRRMRSRQNCWVQEAKRRPSFKEVVRMLPRPCW